MRLNSIENHSLSDFYLTPLECAREYASTTPKIITTFSNTFLLQNEADVAFENASQYAHIENPSLWRERFRVMRFTDKVDLYLLLINEESWIDRWVSVEGNWPIGAPFLALSFHYGAGFWAFRHMRRNCVNVTGIRARLRREDFGGNRIEYFYNKLRNWTLNRELSINSLTAGDNSVRRAINVLRSGKTLVGLFDVASKNRKQCLSLPFLGEMAYFDRGLLFVAKHAKVPIVVFTMSINDDGQTRMLTISDPISSDCEYTAGCAVISFLESALVKNSTQWHGWGGVSDFFQQK